MCSQSLISNLPKAPKGKTFPRSHLCYNGASSCASPVVMAHRSRDFYALAFPVVSTAGCRKRRPALLSNLALRPDQDLAELAARAPGPDRAGAGASARRRRAERSQVVGGAARTRRAALLPL